GYIFRPISALERVMLLAASLLLIKPGWITDTIGLGLLIPVLINQGLLGKLAGLMKKPQPSGSMGE
ncbi:MAG: FxsA family protein, partial [Deltaproteobacteria bacterium]|nr:FxsA family protein [Deltaproteobacteria bacterium]